MPILLDHLEDMDNLKEKIENESEEILKIINLKHFLGLNNEGQVEYLKEILFDFWESQGKRIEQAMKLGERKAEKLINGQRAKEYGPAKKNHQRIADIWTILLDKKLNGAITPEEVVACMIGVKVARLAEDISKDDSWTDVIGYAALGGEIINDKS